MRKITYIEQLEQIEAIIKKCQFCHVAMVAANQKPYLLPFNFGYSNGVVYLHSDLKGKKIDILKQNPAVCINFTTDHELFMQNQNVACSYGMRYRSVIINGNVEFIDNFDDKVAAMNIFMQQYTGRDFKYSAPAINNVCLFKVKIESFTGKIYGYETPM